MAMSITNWINKALDGSTFDYFIHKDQMGYAKYSGVARKIKWIDWMIENHEMFDDGYHPDQVQDMLKNL